MLSEHGRTDPLYGHNEVIQEMLNQQPLPPEYGRMDRPELERRIAARKRHMAGALCILAHHYQRDEVVQFADFVGDSLNLSQQAAARKDARWIVFCGVHFMAESADILSAPEQAVILPHLKAGCNMADMAQDADVEAGLEEVSQLCGERVVPITYVNSSAAIKAITARAGGACCTSSNARNVFEWALTPAERGGAGARRIFAVPDQHLGRNTAVAMGYSLDECAVYDPQKLRGGLTAQAAERARFFLWQGHCYVHQCFKPEHVEAVRREVPGIRVIVHPECPYEVVRLADASGSTEQIIQAVAGAAPGSAWAVGTESNLVERLARRHGDRHVRLLAPMPAHCAMMYRIDLAHLLWVLDNLADGKVVNRISVPPAIAADARIALERMLAIKAAPTITPVQKPR